MSNYRPHDEPVAGYRLIELLGEGAFGAVWKGEGPGGVLVAMKIISKLNGIHAIREWQSLQAVKNLKHANLVNIYGVWLKDEQGHVLTIDEIQALVPAEVEQQAPPTPAPPPPPKSAKRGRPKRKPAIDPASSTLQCETLQVGDSPSSAPPHDLHNAETGSPSGTDSDGAEAAGSAGSGSQGSAGSRERWASLGDKIPPLELVSVMTLGDGTLLDRLKRCQAQGQRGIPRPELMEHLRDAVKGLQFLNDHDVQHCDVKPENLLVVGGSVQVCDYGSALRSIYAKEARTSQGYTEQYAAPEQLGARRIKLHKTTDLYALAITYYALRTGKFPWSDHADEPIPVLKYDERFDFSALGRVSRFRFEGDVLRRAMKRDPAQRQRSVTDFLGDLERAIAQEAAADAAIRRQRRRLVGWAAVAVLLIGLASLGAVYYEDIAGVLRPSSDRARLALLLSEGHWGEALELVGTSKDLSRDEKAVKDTSDQLAKALRVVADVPGADGQFARARQVPEKYRDAALDEIIIQAACQPELDGGDYAAAATSSEQLGELPELKERAQAAIYSRWLAEVDQKTRPAAAAAELVKIAGSLPAFRGKVAELLAQRMVLGLAELDRAIAPSSTRNEDARSDADDLATAAREFNSAGAAPDDEIRRLEHEARLRGLVARLQAGQELAAIRPDVERLQSDLTSSGSPDKVLTARLGLVAAAANAENRLEPQALSALAALAEKLQVNPASIAEPKEWDVALVKQLVDQAFEQAGIRLAATGKLEGELLAALGQLPAGGSADLRLARALLVHASRAEDNAEPLKQAAAWLEDSKSLKTQEEVRAKDALLAWLALTEGGWFRPESLRAALAAFREWRQQAGDAPLADETLAAVLTVLVERSAAATTADAMVAMATVDEALAASSQPEAAALRRLLAEASYHLHQGRATRLALSTGLTKDDFATIQSDLAAIGAAQTVLSAVAGSDLLPPPATPLADLELAALAVESQLHLNPAAKTFPASAKAAWDSLNNALALPAGDKDYASYVRELALLRGWAAPPADALSSQVQSKSDWLKVPLRRQTAAAELLRISGRPPLPPDLQFNEKNAPAFARAAQPLALALAWDSGQPLARAWLPICRRYEAANPDWPAVAALTGPATSDASFLASLPELERLHLWLAHARASEETAAGPAGKLAALAAYAAMLREQCDLFGKEGDVSSDVAFRRLVQPALALIPLDADGDLPAEDALRSNAAAVFGAHGVLLEGDFGRELAAAHYGYPGAPLKFAEATRDAFAAAARCEPDPTLRLRWTTGQARAVDLLLSRPGEEVMEFGSFTRLAKAVAGEWPDTFEANILQGIAAHYESRVAADNARQEELLLAAYERLDKAEATLQGHPQIKTPWCQGWLSQCREALSKVALEQSHLQPWGLKKQKLLNLAVRHAQAAAKVDKDLRISPASCFLCEGNAYEDLAVHLFCFENFEPAEQNFRAAVGAGLDPLVVRQAEAYLGRLLVRRAAIDPEIKDDPAKSEAYREEAIGLLERVSLNLREGSFRDLSLAHEAEFYLADAYLHLLKKTEETSAERPAGGGAAEAASQPKLSGAARAAQLYQRIADESKPGSADRLGNLISVAWHHVSVMRGQTSQQLQASLPELAAAIATIQGELTADSNPDFRAQVAKLQFTMTRTAEERSQRAEEQLAALAQQPGDASLLAQCEILSALARNQPAQDQAATLTRARTIIGNVSHEYDRLTAEMELWQLEQRLSGLAAGKERQAQPAMRLADRAITCAGAGLAAAAKLDELQGALSCAGENKMQTKAAKARLAICKETLVAIGVLTSYEVMARDQLKAAKDDVRRWWKEAKLDQLEPNDGGPSAEEKRKFLQLVGQ